MIFLAVLAVCSAAYMEGSPRQLNAQSGSAMPASAAFGLETDVQAAVSVPTTMRESLAKR